MCFHPLGRFCISADILPGRAAADLQLFAPRRLRTETSLRNYQKANDDTHRQALQASADAMSSHIARGLSNIEQQLEGMHKIWEAERSGLSRRRR